MNLLRLDRVTKQFPVGGDALQVLRGIDLEIDQGEFVAITGPSGSGKTTLLEILGALSRPSSGSYQLDGLDVGALSDDELSDLRAQRLGFVFQTFHLLPRMSAVRNAALPLLYAGVPRKEREAKTADMLRRLGLGDRLEHRPSQLSGGERQRVAIARALANEPRLLLADEPTGNLDVGTGREIMALFDELHAEGRTLAVVTHSAEVAARAERVIRIEDGRILHEEKAVA